MPPVSPAFLCYYVGICYIVCLPLLYMRGLEYKCPTRTRLRILSKHNTTQSPIVTYLIHYIRHNFNSPEVGGHVGLVLGSGGRFEDGPGVRLRRRARRRRRWPRQEESCSSRRRRRGRHDVGGLVTGERAGVEGPGGEGVAPGSGEGERTGGGGGVGRREEELVQHHHCGGARVVGYGSSWCRGLVR